ncbi:hypothetical protein CXB51_033697 [Gossypium anomalum]|uniref:Response regulatory domain-containing protein n=1 Tax=Gossypium anomalum TaxID=47600 RepID=A0A8J6CJ77_9ROSI|nr:hypothetical protein CXB51_033697 [Gossypium anomalum]
MLDMDAFKLLELMGLEMDLPIIMLSAHGDTKLVKKGITHGTCDYLLKPVHIEELKNIWQHVDPSIQEKPRVVWSVKVHRKFVSTVNQLGLDKDFLKKVLNPMNVEGLKRETVASHLHKYKLYLGLNSVVALGSEDPSYLRMGPLDGFGYFCTLTRPGRISSAFLPSYQLGGMFGRLNSSTTLSLHGISSSVIQLGHSQTSNNLINGSRKIQPTVNQNGTLVQGIPTLIDLNQPLQSKPANGTGKFNRVNDLNFQDANVAVGGSCNTLPISSGNPLLLQSNTQHMKHNANLEDFKGDISIVGLNNYIIVNMDYATKQQWGECRHDYNGNTNHSFSRVDT